MRFYMDQPNSKMSSKKYSSLLRTNDVFLMYCTVEDERQPHSQALSLAV